MTTIAELQIKVDATQVDQAKDKIKGLTTATTEAAKAEQQSAKAKNDSSTATEKLLSQIDRETRSLKQLADQQKQLSAAKDSGAINGDQFAKYNQIIQQNITLTKQRGTVVDQQNAKELAAAQKQIAAEEKRQAAAVKAAAQAEAAAEKEIEASQRRSKAIITAIEKERSARDKAAAKESDKAEKQRYQDTLQVMRAQANEEKRLAKEKEDVAKATLAEKRAFDNLLAAIDPTTRELQRLNELEKQLERNRGKISGDQYQKYSAAIDQAREKAERFNSNLNRTGLTAKQVDAALRGLPAQFTDIVVSLQGGQAPLTVLLQQGGQIKDMFGGITPAIKGISQALISMINPWTLAAAAITAFGVVVYSGTNEIEKLNNAIISTGNVSRTSAQEMRDFAASAASIGGTSVSANIDAITRLVQAGKLVPSTFTEISAAATAWAQVTGTAIDDVVDDFNSLGKDPVQSALKLNEQYNFLTASTLKQADAFVQQGREQEAIKVLTDELASVMEQRAKRMADSANIVTKAWRELKRVISDTYESAAEGLSDTPQAQLRAINENIDRFQKKSRNPEGFTEYQNLIKQRSELIAKIYEQRTAEEQEGQSRATENKRVALTSQLLADQKSAMDGVQKAQAKLSAWQGQKDVLDTETYAQGIKLYEAELKKAQDTAAKKGGLHVLDDGDVNDLKNKTAEISSAYKKMFAEIDTAQKSGTLSPQAAYQQRIDLLAKEKTALQSSYEAQIAEMEKLKSASSTTASQRISIDKRISDARSQMTKALTDLDTQQEKLAGNEAERLKKQKQMVDEYSKNAQQLVDNLATQGARARAALGMGDRQAGLFGQLNSEDDRYRAERDRLTASRNVEGADQGAIDQQMEIAAQAHKKATDKINADYKALEKAQGDWSSGATAAWNNFADKAADVSGNTKEFFASTFDGLTDSLTDFITTGKASFSDFATSVLSDLAKILVRMALVQGIKAGASALGFSGFQADGGAWSGGTQFFANGGAFTNSIVSSPTAFGMSGGRTGVMGEAGPEAILPLTRASDGSLGVKAQISSSASSLGGAAGGGVVVYVNIDESGNTSSSSTDSDYTQFGKDIGDFVDQRYQKLMTRDLSPGGQLWKSMQNR